VSPAKRALVKTRLLDIVICTCGTAVIVVLTFLLQDKGW
jgi:hypothetical protein